MIPVVGFALIVGLSIPMIICDRSFIVDMKNNRFVKDGQPYRFVSGSMHYFRVPHQYWKDIMQKMKAAGLIALQTYVEWSGHEPEPGLYNFKGNYDLITFLRTAQEVGLDVIFRPGPYICAERDMGGLPYWLLKGNPNIVLRTMDPDFIVPVDRWMNYLLKMIEPLLYKNGGPIILVQIENEYGQLGRCDKSYMGHLRDLTWSVFGKDVILFKSDVPYDSNYLCDQAEGVLAAANFNQGTNVAAALNTVQRFNNGGPFMVTEYYTGWLDQWGKPHSDVSADAICNTFEQILQANGSVNFYMFHGGTNFGFSNGANFPYVSQPTSYDYGAPLSEAGDPTELYTKLKNIISKYLPVSPKPVPEPVPKLALKSPLKFDYLGSMISFLPSLGTTVNNDYPQTFEDLGIAHGFVVYSTRVDFIPRDPALLTASMVRDRAYVLVDDEFAGVLSRMEEIYSVPLVVQKNQVITLIVENQGRINFGPEDYDPKGLISNVTLNGIVLSKWAMTPMPLNTTDPITSNGSSNTLAVVPGFFVSEFTLESNVQPADTFLDPSGWVKGVAFINGFNLGRYWPVMGPQVTLYVPGVLLKPYPDTNRLIILELERSPCRPNGNQRRDTNYNCQMKLVDIPVINGPVP